MGSKSAKFKLKEGTNVSELVKAIKQGAKDNGIDFEGNEKSGSAKRQGATFSYKVEGKIVTVNVEDSIRTRILKWNAERMMNEIKSWMADYADEIK
jgi:hypothetical protein